MHTTCLMGWVNTTQFIYSNDIIKRSFKSAYPSYKESTGSQCLPPIFSHVSGLDNSLTAPWMRFTFVRFVISLLFIYIFTLSVSFSVTLCLPLSFPTVSLCTYLSSCLFSVSHSLCLTLFLSLSLSLCLCLCLCLSVSVSLSSHRWICWFKALFYYIIALPLTPLYVIICIFYNKNLGIINTDQQCHFPLSRVFSSRAPVSRKWEA